MTIEVPRSFTIRSSFGKLKATVWGPFTSWCQIKTHQPWFSLLWNRNSYIRGGEKYFSKSFTKKLIFKGWTNRVLDPGIVNGMGSCQKKGTIEKQQKTQICPIYIPRTYPCIIKKPDDPNGSSIDIFWFVCTVHWKILFQKLNRYTLLEIMNIKREVPRKTSTNFAYKMTQYLQIITKQF